MISPTYPIDAVTDELKRALATSSSVVLHAPPGAGKTTRVPLALLDLIPKERGRIIMLEPRRIAAVSAARWMAYLLGEQVGGTVGYAIRFDRKVSDRTRIEVVTEGILTRRIQNDQALEGVALVIFDEFHERSIHADLALALCLDARRHLRDDLKLLVMSATLDCGPIADLLGDALIITSEGTAYPVEERYLDDRQARRLPDRIAIAVGVALHETAGDLLVFLPGAGEIRACHDRLSATLRGRDIELHPLYGDLPFEQQERAIMPSSKRKIVLATNIAETSLTIEGVRAVIDSGLTRRLQHDPATGMNRLITVAVSRASAEQRKGRAGRLGPGVCYRLYSKHDFNAMLPFAPPEIMVADLASLVLELAVWGAKEPSSLAWLDAPPDAAWNVARELLVSLGALGASGSVTASGKEMARLPLHPRLARLLLRSAELDAPQLGADLAALLSERDVIRRTGSAGKSDIDIAERFDALSAWRRDNDRAYPDADPWALRAVDRVSGQLLRGIAKKRARTPQQTEDHRVVARLLLDAFPDRIARRRDEGRGRFVLVQGREVQVHATSPLADESFIVAAHLDAGAKGEGAVHLAVPVTEAQIREECGFRIATIRRVEWDDRQKRVIAAREERIGGVLLSSRPFVPKHDETGPVICSAIREHPGLLVFSPGARQFQGRVALVRAVYPGEHWPDLSDDRLFATLEEWLQPFLNNARTAQDIARIDLLPALRSRLTWEQSRLLDERAPLALPVPSGSRIALDYAQGAVPVLAVKLQEMFGLADTPTIAGGRVKVLLHLLSPARRPVQITQDLRAFWNSSYHEAKKELRGRYPKHPWPDDPWNAAPTRKTTRR